MIRTTTQSLGRVITVANQKGGVGKTTNTIHLCAALAQRGRKCVLLDLDATAGATRRLGVPDEGWVDTFDVLTAKDQAAVVVHDAVIRQGDEDVTVPGGFDFIPASRHLTELDDWLSRRENEWVNRADLLVEPIRVLRETYDYIFLDTPPQVTKTLLPAYKASDYVILSTLPESESTEAIVVAVEDVLQAKEKGNAHLRLLGVAVCRVPNPRTRLSEYLMGFIDQQMVDPDGCTYRFETVINKAVALQEAAKAKETIFEYAPSHKCAGQYLELATEIENRIETLENETTTTINRVVPANDPVTEPEVFNG